MSETLPFRFGSGTTSSAVVDIALAIRGAASDKAVTLPPAAYTSQSFFDLEMETIFRKDWICVGHVSQVAELGDYFCVDIAGEPLVVVRGPDRVRALSRVCLHRWAPVAAGSGNTKIFSCPFHKWGYALDGQLLGAPLMHEANNFNPQDCRLPEVRLEIVAGLGFIFISLSDEVAPISDRLSDLVDRLAHWELERFVAVRPNPAEYNFNWKIQIETFMECYHHIGAHTETFEVDYPARLSWIEDPKKGWTVCHSPARREVEDHIHTLGLPLPPALDASERRVCDYILIYPLTVLAVRPDRVHLLNLSPVGPQLTRSLGHTLVMPEAAADPDLLDRAFAPMKEFYAKANDEDTAVNEMQQMGARSSYAAIGRLSHLELTVAHLAEYIRDRITAN